MQAMLGTPIQNILSRGRPFRVLEIGQLALIKSPPEMTPEIGFGSHRLQKLSRTRAIEARIVLNQVARQPLVVDGKRGHKAVERTADVTARQRLPRSPCGWHVSKPWLQPP